MLQSEKGQKELKLFIVYSKKEALLSAMMDLSLATQRTFEMLTCKNRIFCQVFVGDKG